MPENAYRQAHLVEHLARTGRACPERADLDQATPPGLRPAQRCCVQCGRVTARRDPLDGQPWCGGEPITPDQWAAEATGRILPMPGLLPEAA